jgi:isocitrate lyase
MCSCLAPHFQLRAQAREFSQRVRAHHPFTMLAYNLSPSFNWDASGLNDAQISAFQDELGKEGCMGLPTLLTW